MEKVVLVQLVHQWWRTDYMTVVDLGSQTSDSAQGIIREEQ